VTREVLWQFLYWLWVAGEVGLLIATRTRQGSGGSVRDRGSLIILWMVIVAATVVGISYGEMHVPTMFGGAHWIRTVALVLFAAALAFRWTAIVTLGRWFSVNVAIRESQALQTHGVFSIVRHPSYTGLMLIFFAIALHTRSWIAFAIVFVPCAAALIYRTTTEEQALRSAFGDAYSQYAAHTRYRIIPAIW
jgi:protein-S-isoprenylcysteine O-methyltransferase Ste14